MTPRDFVIPPDPPSGHDLLAPSTTSPWLTAWPVPSDPTTSDLSGNSEEQAGIVAGPVRRKKGAPIIDSAVSTPITQRSPETAHTQPMTHQAEPLGLTLSPPMTEALVNALQQRLWQAGSVSGETAPPAYSEHGRAR